MNVTGLSGRLTKDPEIRHTQTGKTVCSFTLAVPRKGKRVEGQPDADFISCVAWNRTAEILESYTYKGAQVGVTGQLRTRNYENQQGQRVYVTEVLVDSLDLLEKPRDIVHNGEQPAAAKATTTTSSYAHNDYYQDPDLGPDYDDLPF